MGTIENITLHLSKYKNILNLLNQLTKCPLYDKEKFDEIITSLPINHNIYVYLENDKIIGMITLIIERKLIHNGKYVAHIEDLVVDKEYNGKGIATKLLNFAIHSAKQFDSYKIILDCSDDLIPFYLKKGFKKSANQMRINIL